VVTLELTEPEARLLVAALDSHEYWQLSDEGYRDSGYVNGPGSDDPETAAEISAARELHAKIEQALN
jgi:hypothetical protein